MPDNEAEAKRTGEATTSGLEANASMLQKLGKLLAAAVKSRAFGRPDFVKQIEEGAKMARLINWTEVLASIEQEAGGVREQLDTHLRERREKLHQSATTAH